MKSKARRASGFSSRIDWRRLRSLAPFLSIAVVVIALALLLRLARHYRWVDIAHSFERIEPGALALASACVAGSWFVQIAFEALAIRYAGRSLPYRQIALASFVSLSIGHSAGFGSAGATRYRIYSRWGFDLRQVAMVIAVAAGSIFLGDLSTSGALLTVEPGSLRIVGLPASLMRLIGLTLLALVAAYVCVAALVRRPLKIFRTSIVLPSWRVALAQIGLGSLNFALAVGTLYAILSSTLSVSYAKILTVCVLGNMVALIGQVPGGVGVLETISLLMIPSPATLSGLLAFRIVYYVVPLMMGTLLLGAFEGRMIGFRKKALGPRVGTYDMPGGQQSERGGEG